METLTHVTVFVHGALGGNYVYFFLICIYLFGCVGSYAMQDLSLQCTDSLAVALGISNWHIGLVAPRCVGS